MKERSGNFLKETWWHHKSESPKTNTVVQEQPDLANQVWKFSNGTSEQRSARQVTAVYGWEMCKCVMSTGYKYARSYPLICVWVDFRAVSPCF